MKRIHTLLELLFQRGERNIYRRIVNSTPLIALAGIRCLGVLQRLYGKVVIPRAVYTEINAKPDSECAKQLKLNEDWIHNNAKKHAQYLGLPVTGTLGVLMKAKTLGYIFELKPLLQKLVDNHIYISQDLINKCLKRVGE